MHNFFTALTPRCCYHERLIYLKNKSIFLTPRVYYIYKEKVNRNKYKGYSSKKCLIKQLLHFPCNSKIKIFYGKWKSGTSNSSHGHTTKHKFMFKFTGLRNRESGRFDWGLGQLNFSFIPSFRRSTASSGNVKKIENSLHSCTMP